MAKLLIAQIELGNAIIEAALSAAGLPKTMPLSSEHPFHPLHDSWLERQAQIEETSGPGTRDVYAGSPLHDHGEMPVGASEGVTPGTRDVYAP